MIESDVDWIPFEFLRWMTSCEGMPGPIELVFFRLTLQAYKSGIGFAQGSSLRLAARCKVDRATYDEAIEYLVEDGKVLVQDGGIAVPSAQKRLQDARDRIDESRNRTAKAREIAAIRRETDCTLKEARAVYAQRHGEGEAVTEEKPDSTAPVIEELPPKERTDNTDRQTEKQKPIWHVPAADAALIWNNNASSFGLPKVDKLTDSRLGHLRARLKDHDGFRDMHGLDLWSFACAQIQHSQFLLGKKGDRQWKANFDSMVRPDNFAKLIEGGYSDPIKPDDDPDEGGNGQLQSILSDWGSDE